MIVEERQIFDEYIRTTGLKTTSQRRLILDTFLGTEKHVSVEDLYRMINRHRRRVGYATVHRTMKLIAECGLAREVVFNDGISRFEHNIEGHHHHHLVCTECQKVIEFASRELDAAEEAVLRKYGFTPQLHSYKIFGICRECRRAGRRETEKIARLREEKN